MYKHMEEQGNRTHVEDNHSGPTRSREDFSCRFGLDKLTACKPCIIRGKHIEHNFYEVDDLETLSPDVDKPKDDSN